MTHTAMASARRSFLVSLQRRRWLTFHKYRYKRVKGFIRIFS